VLWRKDDFKDSPPIFFTSCSPIIVDGMVILQLGSHQNGAIVAYDLTSGNEKWKWDGDPTAYASPILDNVNGMKVIVTATKNKLVAVNVADGKLMWQTSFPEAQMQYNACTPIVEGSTVIFSGANRGTKAVKLDKQAEGLTDKELWSNPDISVQFNSPILKNGRI